MNDQSELDERPSPHRAPGPFTIIITIEWRMMQARTR
jgi:hypothetical protein